VGEVLLAIEGGGSRSRAAIAGAGAILVRSLPGGLNPNDIDRTLMRSRLESLILPLLDLPGPPIGSLRVLAALAGAGRPGIRAESKRLIRDILDPHCSRLDLRVTSDAEGLLETCLTGRDGIVLIAGTGSICLGVKQTRRGTVTARAGGWGSYLDGGGGFRLGLAVLDSALKALDGRGEKTIAVGLICERYDLRLDEMPGYFLPIRREQVAELAALALEACVRGDRTAVGWVRNTVRDLTDLVLAVSERLSLGRDVGLITSGGLFRHPRLSASFKRAVRRPLPGATIRHVADPLALLIGTMLRGGPG
jgi:N-acetylglucosamine kinase-like BadF-type ATPase